MFDKLKVLQVSSGVPYIYIIITILLNLNYNDLLLTVNFFDYHYFLSPTSTNIFLLICMDFELVHFPPFNFGTINLLISRDIGTLFHYVTHSHYQCL